MALGYCLTIFVEARSGLKFPAPPTFASGLYLQCLGVAFGFMTLAIWFTYHAAMRAQIACVQLRTRSCRVPVPTQRQLDNARKILSTYEEQSVYDMFRLPFVLPNTGDTPNQIAEEEEGKLKKDKKDQKGGYTKGGLPGVAAAVKGKVKDLGTSTGGSAKELGHAAKMPGLTSGVPSWVAKEYEQRDIDPASSPSGYGLEMPPEPYAHFERIREAQKDYWCAEAYTRVTFLFGMIHMIQSFAYWLALHNVGELGMMWCAVVCASSLSAACWIMFRLDVLPDHGGCFPIEIGGPFIEAVSLALAYTHEPNSTTLNLSRAAGVVCILMQMAFTFRMYMVAMPSGIDPTHGAKESGGRLFNKSAACELPTWLPAAFQHVTYLVAPPKTQGQLQQEKEDRDCKKIKDDPLVSVDMTPWYYTRVMLIFVFLGWAILLTGRLVECVMGERMLVTNPGAPPWSRVGQWHGWESGPISSKHYAHVTPQRGHFAWQKGWGPQGRQELWASDMFGFHPEADMHWAEEEGPEPLIGAAAGTGSGKENTWAMGVLSYGDNLEGKLPHQIRHDWDESGGHRRLRTVEPGVVRPLVPTAVQWPVNMQPEHLACGSKHGETAAFTTNGAGVILPPFAATGQSSGVAAPLSLEGLLPLGTVRGISWAKSGLLVATATGIAAHCPIKGESAICAAMEGVPKLPFPAGSPVATAIIESEGEQPLRVAMAHPGSKIQLYELSAEVGEWKLTAEALVPFTAEGQLEPPKILSVSATHSHMLATAADGSTFHWTIQMGRATSRPYRVAPAAGPRRSWHSSCMLPCGTEMRLASNWRRAADGLIQYQPEVLV
eukprot:TRINITY_DN7814_c0_g2_i2.p1 TRINITY_DN7814_c0_g2~~TRINITY_DN7814_c0_g2_i2.p1  ORF type:complete len:938 (+),score=167.69 TRINITY_DN7814_c0_g2_i2:327-2816(+)